MSIDVKIFISSKFGELDTERAIIGEQTRSLKLKPIFGEEWSPRRRQVRDLYLDQVRKCPVYVGIFYRKYSIPTIEEYSAAMDNPYREALIYIRQDDSQKRDNRLKDFLEKIQDQHLCYQYNKPEELLSFIPRHLEDAVSRLVKLVMKLGNAPEGGLAWGELDEPSLEDPVKEILKSVGFEGGRFDQQKAEKLIKLLKKGMNL